jgi:hypothetical protein
MGRSSFFLLVYHCGNGVGKIEYKKSTLCKLAATPRLAALGTPDGGGKPPPYRGVEGGRR